MEQSAWVKQIKHSRGEGWALGTSGGNEKTVLREDSYKDAREKGKQRRGNTVLNNW